MDPSLIETLWRAERDAMVRAVFLTCGDVHRSAEVVDEAFATVFARTTRPPAIDDLRSYLWRAAFNGARQAGRRRRRDDETVELIGRRRVERSDGAEVEPWDDLADCLATLEPRTRAAIVLRYYGDFTVPQVADQLGIPLGTAKSLLHRGLVALRGQLEPTTRSDLR